MPLFEVAIIQKPTKKEIEEGTGIEKLLYGPTAVLAATQQTAGMIAMMAPSAPKDADMLQRCEVIVRPFQ